MTSQQTYTDAANVHYELLAGGERGVIKLTDLDSGKLLLVRGGKIEEIRTLWNRNLETVIALDMAAKATAVIQ
jgi:uncharacterized Zn finger protein